MKKLVPILAALALTACASGLTATRGERIDWRCASGAAFSIRINDAAQKAEVFAGGRTYDLNHVGTGYSNEQVRYFEQGGMASLTGAHGGPYDNCRRG
jgi:hypothetical protein